MSQISIITPCYNAQNYNVAVIASVREQTLTDWEHGGQLTTNQQHQRQQEEKLHAHWRQKQWLPALRFFVGAACRVCRQRLGLGF